MQGIIFHWTHLIFVQINLCFLVEVFLSVSLYTVIKHFRCKDTPPASCDMVSYRNPPCQRFLFFFRKETRYTGLTQEDFLYPWSPQGSEDPQLCQYSFYAAFSPWKRETSSKSYTHTAGSRLVSFCKPEETNQVSPVKVDASKMADAG